MEISGSIKKIGDTQKITDTFRKREVVVTTEEQYPQHIQIEFIQDRTSLLDGYNLGDKVNIGFNLKGREWTSPQGETKYFNTIQGWRIEKAGAPAAGASSQGAADMPPMPPMDDEEDDLPF